CGIPPSAPLPFGNLRAQVRLSGAEGVRDVVVRETLPMMIEAARRVLAWCWAIGVAGSLAHGAPSTAPATRPASRPVFESDLSGLASAPEGGSTTTAAPGEH